MVFAQHPVGPTCADCYNFANHAAGKGPFLFLIQIKSETFSQEETMATELVLIRHGYTVRVHGDYVHAPLTPLGQQQAAQTGQYLSAS